MRIQRGELFILATMAFGVLMDGIDGSIVNVALPAVAHSFGTDTSTVSWVTIIYFMMMAGLLLPFGRVADSGRIRRVFLAGFGIFTIGSLLCALSPTLAMLVTSRVVQGVGAAMIGAAAPMICVKMLPSEHLGRSMGVMSLAAAAGFALGPAVGGIIVEYLSWHWIFLINIPIGVFGIVFGHFAMPREEPSKISLDLKGSAILFAAIVFLVLALERMSYPDVRSLCIASFVISLALFVTFAVIELRTARPLLDVRIFKLWRMDMTLASYTLINLVYMGVLYILPFYMDLEMSLSSLMSGIILLIPSLFSLVMCIPVGNYSDVHGRRGFAISSSFFMVVYTVMLYFIHPDMGLWPLVVVAAVMGVVWGLCGATSSSRIIDNMPEREKPIGSSLMNFMVYMGGTVGTALFASLLTAGADAGGVPIEDLSSEAFLTGMQYSMMWAIGLSVISLLTAWVVNENRKKGEENSEGVCRQA